MVQTKICFYLTPGLKSKLTANGPHGRGKGRGKLGRVFRHLEDLQPQKLNFSGTITLLAISSNINNLFALVIGLGRG